MVDMSDRHHAHIRLVFRHPARLLLHPQLHPQLPHRQPLHRLRPHHSLHGILLDFSRSVAAGHHLHRRPSRPLQEKLTPPRHPPRHQNPLTAYRPAPRDHSDPRDPRGPYRTAPAARHATSSYNFLAKNRKGVQLSSALLCGF